MILVLSLSVSSPAILRTVCLSVIFGGTTFAVCELSSVALEVNLMQDFHVEMEKVMYAALLK